MYLSPKEPKKRDFYKGQPLTLTDEPKKSNKLDSCLTKKKTKQKQHKNTSKHERYENSSLTDIPDDEDAFFERT